MRFRTRPVPVLEASTCNEHLPGAMRHVAPANSENTGNTDTHVLVRRIELPEPTRLCWFCGDAANWHLTTLEVIR